MIFMLNVWGVGFKIRSCLCALRARFKSECECGAKVQKTSQKLEAVNGVEMKLLGKADIYVKVHGVSIKRLRGILVQLVICMSPGHPKIKIANFMKYITFA